MDAPPPAASQCQGGVVDRPPKEASVGQARTIGLDMEWAPWGGQVEEGKLTRVGLPGMEAHAEVPNPGQGSTLRPDMLM